MQHDAKRLRMVRESMGMTQEKLAILASVSERTVQRAEAGHNMSLETLNDFAAALEMPLTSLVIDPEEINSEEPLGLRRVTSPRVMTEQLAKAGVAVFECEVDAAGGELEPLLKLVDLIEQRLPQPWEIDQHPGTGTLKERLVAGAALADALAELEAFGIGLYAATYWLMARYPLYDMDEGHRYTRGGQAFERVMALHIVIARAHQDRLYRKAPSSWGLDLQPPPELPTGTAGEWGDLDDEVPF